MATFAVITKRDVAEKQGKLEQIEEQTSALKAELGIPEERVLVVAQYCSEVTPRMARSEEVDSEMCYLWQLLLDPVYSKPAGLVNRKDLR